MTPSEGPPDSKPFRILSVDGGGIRGLISVLILEEIEKRLSEKLERTVRIADFFHLFAGTSTGGLIALSLTSPKGLSATDLTAFYIEDGPTIFSRSPWRKLTTLWGLAGPKYSSTPLREAVERRLGISKVSEATRDLMVTSYDMNGSEPYFFKRWRALEDPQQRDFPIADAALSTAAAPTYFPSHGLDSRALVDGGVFAGNPTIAAIAEALGRQSDPPAGLQPHDLFLVSIGTGEFASGFEQGRVSGWGDIAWVAAGGHGPPILDAMLGGSSDGTDYWAHMLLNHAPGATPPEQDGIGRGPRYFRLQAELTEPIAMDDASSETLTVKLPEAAARLIHERGEELDAIVGHLAGEPPV